MSIERDDATNLALERAAKALAAEQASEQAVHMRRVERSQRLATEKATRTSRRQLTALGIGTFTLAAGLYAGGAIVSLYSPSTGNSLVNVLPPTHVLTLPGHRQDVSAQVNWELAKAAQNPAYRAQLMVAANANTFVKNAREGFDQREHIRNEILMHLQSDDTLTNTATAFSTNATENQIAAGNILIAQHLANSGAAAPHMTGSTSEESPSTRANHLSDSFVKQVRSGQIVLKGATIQHNITTLEDRGKITEAEAENLRHAWTMATGENNKDQANTAQALTFATRAQRILAAEHGNSAPNLMQQVIK